MGYIKLIIILLLTSISSLSISEDISTVNIVAVGDVMMHGGELRSGYLGDNQYNFNSFFTSIKPIVEKADIAIANLETTLAGDKYKFSGYPQFNSPDAIIDALNLSGFTTLVTANNHSLDTGIDGLTRTNQIIKSKGLDVVGTSDVNNSPKYIIKKINNITIAIAAYTQHANGLERRYSEEELQTHLNIIDKEQIKKDLKEIKTYNPDVILVYMHWGDEYKKAPNTFQKDYAKFLNENGVNIIIGSHPHVIQKTEEIQSAYGTTYIFYSLGNFISNQRVETLGDKYRATEDGALVEIEVQKDNKTNKVTLNINQAKPTWVYRKKKENNSNYYFEVIPIKETLASKRDLPNTIISRLNNSYNTTNSRLYGGDDK